MIAAISAIISRFGIFLRASMRVMQLVGNRIALALAWEVPAKKYERWGLYTQSFFVVIVYAFMQLHPAFTGRPVATGYMIAALAMAAVVMAARTDSLTPTEKIVWIAICTVLFIWELKVIDDDHIAQEKQHQIDITQQAIEFNGIITEDQRAFSATMRELSIAEGSQQDQFRTTMREFLKNETANQARFDRLVDHEEKLGKL